MTIQLINGVFNRVSIEHDDNADSPREWDNLGTMVCWHRNYRLGDEQPNSDPADFRRSLACDFDPNLEDRLERLDQWWEDRYPAWSYGNARWQEWCKEKEQDFEEKISAVLEKHIIELPLYLYDHSGITMSTSSFSCRWDSGQVGFIYVTKDKVRKEYGWKNITKDRLEKIYKYLNGEVETYDLYLTGQCYGVKHETAPIPEDWAYLALLEADEAAAIIEKYLDLAEDLDWDEEDSCWGFLGYDHEKSGLLHHVSADVRHLAVENF